MFSARAAPVNTAVRPTTGSDMKPMAISCRPSWPRNQGPVSAAPRPRPANSDTAPTLRRTPRGSAPPAATGLKRAGRATAAILGRSGRGGFGRGVLGLDHLADQAEQIDRPLGICDLAARFDHVLGAARLDGDKIGRASCRERV